MPRPLVEVPTQGRAANTSSATSRRSASRQDSHLHAQAPFSAITAPGVHTHLTLWKDNQPLLAGQGYAGLSDLGIHAIGGLIKHAAALCAFANPTTNSFTSGSSLASRPPPRSRTAAATAAMACHYPHSGQQPEPQKPPDSSTASSRQCRQSLLALLSHAHGRSGRGPEQTAARRAARQRHPMTSSPKSSETVPTTCSARWRPRSTPSNPTTSFCYARRRLVTPDIIDTWIWYKQSHEVETIRVRPHPYEFAAFIMTCETTRSP